MVVLYKILIIYNTISTVIIRVKDDRIYFILFYFFIFYFILYLFFNLELRVSVSVISYVIVTYVTRYNGDITPITELLHISQSQVI